jgi:hypothetical protein
MFVKWFWTGLGQSHHHKDYGPIVKIVSYDTKLERRFGPRCGNTHWRRFLFDGGTIAGNYNYYCWICVKHIMENEILERKTPKSKINFPFE